MEKILQKVKALGTSAREYLQVYLEMAKLEAAEKLSAIIGNSVAAAVVFVLLLCFTAFIGVGLSLLIGEWLHRMWAGFLVVSVLYFFKAILIWKMRDRWIRIPVMNSLIRQLFKDDAQD